MNLNQLFRKREITWDRTTVPHSTEVAATVCGMQMGRKQKATQPNTFQEKLSARGVREEQWVFYRVYPRGSP